MRHKWMIGPVVMQDTNLAPAHKGYPTSSDDEYELQKQQIFPGMTANHHDYAKEMEMYDKIQQINGIGSKKQGKKKGSSSKGKSHSGGTYRPSGPVYDLTAQMMELYRQHMESRQAYEQRRIAQLKEQLEQRRQAELAARQKREQELTKGYNDLLRAAKESYDKMAFLRRQGYDDAAGKVNTAAERAMQQAFIAKEMEKRYMGQQLAAMGRNGGATETTMLGLANAYGRERGKVEHSRMERLAEMQSRAAAENAQALDAYNRAKAGYDSDYQRRLAELNAQSAQRLHDFDAGYSEHMSRLEEESEKQKLQLLREQQEMLLKAQQDMNRTSHRR